MIRASLFRWQLVAFVVVLAAVAVWARSAREAPSPREVARPVISESPRSEPPRAAHTLTGTPDSRVRECQTGLKSVATALEMYATDHSGQYPTDLTELVPTYMPTLPSCPSSGQNSYLDGYKIGQGAPYNDQDFKDFYHLACSGQHHADAGLEANLPAFNGRLGLMPDMPFLGTPQEARQACAENLKLIATSVEMYAIDNNGRYPESLRLSGNYLPKVPLCQATGKDTYTSTYKVGPSAPHNSGDFREYYYLECSGSHVGAKPPTGPCYDSVRGLSDQAK